VALVACLYFLSGSGTWLVARKNQEPVGLSRISLDLQSVRVLG
jgi:hypothetical protein